MLANSHICICCFRKCRKSTVLHSTKKCRCKYAMSLSHLHLPPIFNMKSTSGWDGKCIPDITDYWSQIFSGMSIPPHFNFSLPCIDVNSSLANSWQGFFVSYEYTLHFVVPISRDFCIPPVSPCILKYSRQKLSIISGEILYKCSVVFLHLFSLFKSKYTIEQHGDTSHT